jgi:hypothetical protein
MNSDALTTAVQVCFAGERHEGFAILGFSVALAATPRSPAVSVATRGLMP